MDFSYVCKKYPWIMRPLFALMLVTGLLSLLIVIVFIIEEFEEFKSNHLDVIEYIKKGKKYYSED